LPKSFYAELSNIVVYYVSFAVANEKNLLVVGILIQIPVAFFGNRYYNKTISVFDIYVTELTYYGVSYNINLENVMDISTILLIVFAVITVLVVLFALLMGFKRTWLQSSIRLGVLVVAVIVSALVGLAVAAYVVKFAIEYAGDMDLGDSTLNEVIAYIGAEGTSGEEIQKLLVAAIAPLTFFVVFIVLNLLFLIIYSIVGACLFSQGHKKRVAKRNGEVYTTSTWRRLLSLGLNLVICFSVASMLLVPVTYYVPLAYTAITEYSEIASDTSTTSEQTTSTSTSSSDSEDTYVTILKTVADSAIVKVYGIEGSLVSNSVTTIETDGSRVTLTQLMDDVVPVLQEVSGLSSAEDISSEKLYTVADDIEKDVYVDKLVGGIVQDAAKNWKEGDDFLGVEPPELQNETISQSVYTVLAKQDKISDSLRAVGHIYSLSQVLTADSVSVDTMTTLTSNLTEDSVEIVKDLLSTSVVEELGVNDSNLADAITTAVGGMLDGLYEVKSTGTTEDIERESKAVAKVFDAVQNADSLTENDAKDMLDALKESTVIQGTLKTLVEDDDNPLQVEVDDSSAKVIKDALKENQIEENSDLYNTIMTMFGIED
jgi:hypothetical protein